MKSKLLFLLFLVPLLALSCLVQIQPSLESDFVLGIGMLDGATTTFRGAIGGKLPIPFSVGDLSGKVVSGDFTVTLTLSVDNSISSTGDNTDLGTITVTGGTNNVHEIDIPATVTAGIYNLFAVLSASDTVQNNNQVIVTVDIGVNQPDLRLRRDSANLVRALAGTTLPISYTIINNGYTVIAAGTAIPIDFSMTLSGTPTSLGSQTITLTSTLYPNQYISDTFKISVPTLTVLANDQGVAETDLGDVTKTLTVFLDNTNSITESNEGNNQVTLDIISGNPLPDLQISSIDYYSDSGFAKNGNQINMGVTVYNTGTTIAPAGSYTLRLYVDKNGDSSYDDTNDTILHAWADTPLIPYDSNLTIDPSILPTMNEKNSVTITVPSGTVYPSGLNAAYTVRADITGALKEQNTTNNGLNHVGSISFRDALKDLELTDAAIDLTTAASNDVNTTFNITYSLTNNEEDAVENDFLVQFYASPDNTLSPAGDINLGNATITDTISGNSKITKTTSLTVPAGTTRGFYTLYWNVDSNDSVLETNDNNNMFTSADGNAYVFIPVRDNTTATISADLFVKIHENNNNQWGYIYLLDSNSTSTLSSTNYSSVTTYTLGPISYSPSTLYNIRIQNYKSSYYDKLPYAFRFVPTYISTIPSTKLPNALMLEDGFAGNDTPDTAATLSGGNHPFFNFVSGYIEINNHTTTFNDYWVYDCFKFTLE